MQMVGTVMNHDVLNQKTIHDNRYAKVLVENIMNVLDWLFINESLPVQYLLGELKSVLRNCKTTKKRPPELWSFTQKEMPNLPNSMLQLCIVLINALVDEK